MIKLSKQDFENATPILIIYPFGAGGKTIGNLLALGDNAVFMDSRCVQLQQQNCFTATDKLNFLLNRLEKSKTDNNWNDLGMGENFFLTPDFESPIQRDYSDNFFYEEVKWLIESKTYFFLSAHDLREIKITLKMWPKAKIIVLTNSYDFIVNKRKNYSFTLQNEWNDIRGSDWPERFPKNLEEYFKLDDYIKKEIQELYDDIFYNTLVLFDEKKFNKEMKIITSKKYLSWDVEWFFDRNKTVKEIQKLYAKLNIKDFNVQAVETYFDAWFSQTKL